MPKLTRTEEDDHQAGLNLIAPDTHDVYILRHRLSVAIATRNAVPFVTRKTARQAQRDVEFAQQSINAYESRMRDLFDKLPRQWRVAIHNSSWRMNGCECVPLNLTRGDIKWKKAQSKAARKKTA